MTFWPDAWAPILVPEAPIAELIVRGTAIYIFLLAVMRVVGRRLFAQFAMSDVLVVLVLAVAVRDGITGEYQTVGDAAISALTIVAWDMGIDRLAFHFEPLRKLLRHEPLPIIKEGRLLVENARRNLLTRPEIMERLREHGVNSFDQVEEAYLEQDGSFSVVKMGGQG